MVNEVDLCGHATLAMAHILFKIEIDFGQTINPWIRGVIITSTSTTTDFISRFFSPWYGVLEDPVTGSAHTVLAVYWSRFNSLWLSKKYSRWIY